MSYCRANGTDSDVYVIATSDGKKAVWECVGCSLTKERYGKTAHTRTQMLCHLTHHRGVGDKVPQRAIDRLNRERDEIDAG
jgi:hypothetical protein